MAKQIFAGIGLGLLTGILIGLSISEVVGVLIGALAALLAGFFGLRGNKDGETGNQLIIGSFGITCVIAIFIGIYCRVHNVMAPSLAEQVELYRKASFDSVEIKKIILAKELGILPDGSKFSKEVMQAKGSVLMGNEGYEICTDINESSSLEEIKAAFENSSGFYSELQRSLSASITDPNELRKTLLLIKQAACQH